MKRIGILIVALAGLASACNLSTAPSATRVPTATTPSSEVAASATPAAEPTEAVVLSGNVCLAAGQGEVQFLSEAGGYCFLLPDSFSVSRDLGLDIFAVGPTLATFGQDRLALIVEFNVIGAPGGAGEHDPQGWGTYIAAESSTPEFEVRVEPTVFGEMNLEGVRVGPLPGLVSGEAVFLRTNGTLYGITVHPAGESEPEYSEQVEQLWATLNASTRFLTPVETGVDYRTEHEVCPTEKADTQLVINLAEGWCALVPASWHSDEAFNFPGRFVGGPEIGEFWPGQPPYANVVVGFGGPVADTTLEQRIEGRMNANGRPDLVLRNDPTLGGYPAVILDTHDGPIPERVAFTYVNGWDYTVLGIPFDAVSYPEAQPELEAAWELITGSIQFFEPYR